jgi:hypothetical protein
MIKGFVLGMIEPIRFSAVDPASLQCAQNLHTLWRVTGKNSGLEYGFVASHVYSRMKSNGNIQETMMWGSAVKAEEFITGITFPHRLRRGAISDLHRKWSLSVPFDLENGLAKLEKGVF